MIPAYINDWLTIIEMMNNDNTYKLAWGRAILECINHDYFIADDDRVTVYFDHISECMLKYYWNQIFFFKLKQSPYFDKEPVICKYTKEAIEKYKKIVKSEYPVWFDKGQIELKKFEPKFYDKLIKQISTILHQNVSYRFKNVTNKILDIYKYSKADGSFITVSFDEMKMLKNYNVILSELMNYKWSQLLEKFNYQPKIASKVNGISDSQIKRNSLIKYKEILLEQFSNGKIIDFYSGQEIGYDEISIDHVIPWSFMYSDDIWNLVITTKRNNSIKSNSIPKIQDIERLKERNNKLVKIIDDNKMRESLIISIENNLVDKFYYDCKL